jgi:hypothetical protein
MNDLEREAEKIGDRVAEKVAKAMCTIGKCPAWLFFRDGVDESVLWTDHSANPRFAVYISQGGGTATPDSQDVVLDKETGLIWARNANLLGPRNWLDANTLCRELELANRMGWRLPTVEELSSLIDPRQGPLALPPGHPFQNVQHGSGVPAYWSASNAENPAGAAWFVNPWRGAGPHLAGLGNKSIPGFAWPVRGGSAGVSWNW